MSGSILQAVRVAPWGPGGTPVSVTAASSTAIDFTASKGSGVLFKSTVPFHMRFGTSAVGAATTNDLLLEANVLYRVDIPDPAADWGYARIIRSGGSDGTFYYATIQY